jgi:hypothetical protein
VGAADAVGILLPAGLALVMHHICSADFGTLVFAYVCRPHMRKHKTQMQELLGFYLGPTGGKIVSGFASELLLLSDTTVAASVCLD